MLISLTHMGLTCSAVRHTLVGGHILNYTVMSILGFLLKHYGLACVGALVTDFTQQSLKMLRIFSATRVSSSYTFKL